MNYLSNINSKELRDCLENGINKLKEENSIVEFYVSSDIKNIKMNNIEDDLCKLYYSFINNMLEGIKENVVKNASIMIYVKDNMLCSDFANMFVKDISVFNNISISNVRYSNYFIDTKIIDNYYVQHLEVINS